MTNLSFATTLVVVEQDLALHMDLHKDQRRRRRKRRGKGRARRLIRWRRRLTTIKV
jgi:hypothetical protein